MKVSSEKNWVAGNERCFFGWKHISTETNNKNTKPEKKQNNPLNKQIETDNCKSIIYKKEIVN